MNGLLGVACLLLVIQVTGSYSPPSSITWKTQNGLPEGVDYHDTTGFIVGSIGLGTLYSIADDGSVRPWSSGWAPNVPGVGTFGIQVDAPRGRVLAARANFGSGIANLSAVNLDFSAGLLSFDIHTGELIQDIDLSWVGANTSTGHAANDVAVDMNGNAYVTDIGGAQLWKVTPSGVATQFVHSDLMQGTVDPTHNPAGIGADGVEYVPPTAASPNGFLIVGIYGDDASAKLLKVTIPSGSDKPTVTQITLTGGYSIGGADGIYMSRGKLFVGGTSFGKVYALSSGDEWASAILVQTYTFPTHPECSTPTAVTNRAGMMYALCGAGYSATANYSIQRFDVPPPRTIIPYGNTIVPEGYSFDESLGYLVGSIGTGHISRVSDGGVSVVWSQTPAPDGQGIYGVQADRPNGRVLACTYSEANHKAGVMSFNINNGELLQYYELGNLTSPPSGFANDVAVDLSGNMYVTDVTGGLVWRITAAGHTSVFTSSPLLNYTGTGLGGPDGIVFVPPTPTEPQGFLLVNIFSTVAPYSKLLKVSIPFTGTPTCQLHPTSSACQPTVSPVTLTGGFQITGSDGMILYYGRLWISGTSTGLVYELSSSDDWASATLVAAHAISPPECQFDPAVVARGSQIFVMCNDGFSSASNATYSINLVTTTQAPSRNTVHETWIEYSAAVGSGNIAGAASYMSPSLQLQWHGASHGQLAPLASPAPFAGPTGFLQFGGLTQSQYLNYAIDPSTVEVVGISADTIVVRLSESGVTSSSGVPILEEPNLIVYRVNSDNMFTNIDIFVDSVGYEAAACKGNFVCNPHLNYNYTVSEMAPTFSFPPSASLHALDGYTADEIANHQLVLSYFSGITAAGPDLQMVSNTVRLTFHGSPAFWNLGGTRVGKTQFRQAFEQVNQYYSGVTQSQVRDVIAVRDTKVIIAWDEESMRLDTGKKFDSMTNIVQFTISSAGGVRLIESVDYFVNSHVYATQACGGELVCQSAQAVPLVPASSSSSAQSTASCPSNSNTGPIVTTIVWGLVLTLAGVMYVRSLMQGNSASGGWRSTQMSEPFIDRA